MRIAEHCARLPDLSPRLPPLRACISYYKHGEGKRPRSLAYYGGGKLHKHPIPAQSVAGAVMCSKQI